MAEKKENQMEKIKEYEEVKEVKTPEKTELSVEQLWANYGKAQARREALAQELEQLRQFMANTYQEIAKQNKEDK